MPTKPMALEDVPARHKAEAIRACIAYTLQDASALGLVTAALHLKLAILEIDEALKSEPETTPAS